VAALERIPILGGAVVSKFFISLFFSISLIAFLSSAAYAGRDGFPGRRAGGGSRNVPTSMVLGGEFPTTNDFVDVLVAPQPVASSDG
jgi:hypothetical protein